MADVSMKRLREMAQNYFDAEGAAAAVELIRLRELIVSGADQRIERNRCRALLEVGE